MAFHLSLIFGHLNFTVVNGNIIDERWILGAFHFINKNITLLSSQAINKIDHYNFWSKLRIIGILYFLSGCYRPKTVGVWFRCFLLLTLTDYMTSSLCVIKTLSVTSANHWMSMISSYFDIKFKVHYYWCCFSLNSYSKFYVYSAEIWFFIMIII